MLSCISYSVILFLILLYLPYRYVGCSLTFFFLYEISALFNHFITTYFATKSFGACTTSSSGSEAIAQKTPFESQVPFVSYIMVHNPEDPEMPPLEYLGNSEWSNIGASHNNCQDNTASPYNNNKHEIIKKLIHLIFCLI